ncbi:hypothetical protein [Streptomyces sp. NBC_00212]|uniref:hypothetical protein n=1 Tax=Streptomyces sp. NBC_00212 TaxID=2975684 RepID=UPI00324B1882
MRDYETRPERPEAMLALAAITLMTRRLTRLLPGPTRLCRDPSKPSKLLELPRGWRRHRDGRDDAVHRVVEERLSLAGFIAVRADTAALVSKEGPTTAAGAACLGSLTPHRALREGGLTN